MPGPVLLRRSAAFAINEHVLVDVLEELLQLLVGLVAGPLGRRRASRAGASFPGRSSDVRCCRAWPGSPSRSGDPPRSQHRRRARSPEIRADVRGIQVVRRLIVGVEPAADGSQGSLVQVGMHAGRRRPAARWSWSSIVSCVCSAFARRPRPRKGAAAGGPSLGMPKRFGPHGFGIGAGSRGANSSFRACAASSSSGVPLTGAAMMNRFSTSRFGNLPTPMSRRSSFSR